MDIAIRRLDVPGYRLRGNDDRENVVDRSDARPGASSGHPTQDSPPFLTGCLHAPQLLGSNAYLYSIVNMTAEFALPGVTVAAVAMEDVHDRRLELRTAGLWA